MKSLEDIFANNLKGEVIEDFSKKESYEPCDEELRQSIREVLIQQSKARLEASRHFVL